MNQQKIRYVPVAVVEKWHDHIGKDDREGIDDALDEGWPLMKQYLHFVLGQFVKGFSDPEMKKWVFFPSEGRYLPERLAPF